MGSKTCCGVNIRQFAAACGKSIPWVTFYRASGHIPQYEDGSIPLEEGLVAAKKIMDLGTRKGVSIAEFVRQSGKSKQWVREACAGGRIPQYEDGSIPLEEGLAAVKALSKKKIKSKKVAKAAGAKTKTQTVIADVKKLETVLPQGFSWKDKISNAQLAQLDRLEPIKVPESIAAIAKMYDQAKAEDKAYQARIRELDYRQREGELIERSVVEADAAAVASEVRSRLVSMAVRIAGRCEGRTAREIEGIIEDGINEALESLQKSRFYTASQEQLNQS